MENTVNSLIAERNQVARQVSAENEGGYGDTTRLDRIDAKLENAIKEAIKAEWTKEVTISRRAAWNAAVKSGEVLTGGKVDGNKVAALETRLGFNGTSLKAAVKRHAL